MPEASDTAADAEPELETDTEAEADADDKDSTQSFPTFDEMPYKFRPLLTDTELDFSRYLRALTIPYNVYVCPKVRMEDIINLTCWNKYQRRKYRGYIKSRHIDFLLCDKNMTVLCAVELDDRSHRSKAARAVDEFDWKILFM